MEINLNGGRRVECTRRRFSRGKEENGSLRRGLSFVPVCRARMGQGAVSDGAAVR